MRGSAGTVEHLPPLLPPRRPTSLPNLTKADSSWHVSTSQPHIESPPPFLPPRRPSTSGHSRAVEKTPAYKPTQRNINQTAQRLESRPTSLSSLSSVDTATFVEPSLQRTSSNGSDRQSKRRSRIGPGAESPVRTPSLEPIRDGELLDTRAVALLSRRPQRHPSLLRNSSLRIMSRPSEDELEPPMLPPPALTASYSDSHLGSNRLRPRTHPPSQFVSRRKGDPKGPDLESFMSEEDDPWRLPALPPSRPSTPLSQKAVSPKPRPSFTRLSSLDNLMTYRDEKAEWRASRPSSMLQHPPSESEIEYCSQERAKTFAILDDSVTSKDGEGTDGSEPVQPDDLPQDQVVTVERRSRFRHIAAEIGFCFTIAMTQFLAEYLITGFAIELPALLSRTMTVRPGSMGMFWPASLLSLILSATLFIFARLSDMYSGYYIFMSGVAWLAIWSLIPGFCTTLIWLDISRAMQGLAIAAFLPSTFAMVGSIYPEGQRRNFVMGLYSGCAPLGFFAGFLSAGTLPRDKPQWYFWICSAIAATTFITAFLSVPSDRTDRRKLGLKMDWIGSFLIMAGLILVSYALSVEPYANRFELAKSGFALPTVIGPFASGIICLAVAFWYEGWCATCPLLPFDFFKPKSVKPFSLACLCFYASYGVWLYNSAQFFQSSTGTTGFADGVSGITLALWYTPTAIGGVVLCIVGGSLMHIVPIMVLLLISALAWIAAPLLLALASLPLDYWSIVMPSMLCATIGIDLTFTISIVFFSSVQPLRFQGLSGAVCSSLVNLAISFALSISEIVMTRAEGGAFVPVKSIHWGFKATFLYGAASASVGFVLCVAFVRISRAVVREQKEDEERPRPTSSESTLVDEQGEQQDQEAA